MFINIDHEKRPSDYKLHLAKPNKEIISVLHERQNSALNLKLGNISELNFSIPYFVEDSNLQMIKNPNIERIRELMYVKLTWGEFEEWFLIDNITESSEDNEIMNVQSFSIGYENKRKKINEFKETAINATEFYTEILKDSPWSIGEIDGSFDLLYRSFDESGTDRFELIKTGAETFGGVIVWDTNNKKINLKEPDNIGEFRGLTVSYDRLMSSLNKTRTTDEMVTRLYVYGNERITIENKNPTNEKYIEDYSYFMHPFKRDANKNVLESSYYMSDSLCHALLDNKELRDEYEPQIKTIQGNIENKNSSLSLAMIELNDAEFTLMSAKGLLDIAKAVDDKALIEQRKIEVANATSIVNTKKTAVNNLTSQIEGLQNQVSVLQNAISVRSFTKELIDELEPYIIEKEIEDARYINEDELYEFAKEKFSEIREPRVVIETGIEGLMNSVEEQYYWDKLVLGDTMRVRQKRMDIDYKSRIIEMSVGLDDSDVDVKIANFTENVDNLDKFISILYSSESNSTILNNNKHKWDSVVEMRDQVTQLRDSEIDATKKRITAGVNESVEIGERGIVITTPSFPNEMIIMQAGVIALSEDGGETWKTSVTPNGVVAETVIGKLIAGNNLIITNDSGSIVMDGDGLEIESDSIKIMSGGENPKNLIDDWNNMIINMEDFANDGTVTPYEKSQISHQWNMISDSHSKIIESFIKNMGVETPENPYPHEYDDYLIAYENLKEYLFTINQSDGYTLLNPDRMDIASPIDIGTYRLLVRSFTSTKDNFILVMPMEYANAYMEVLESSISLNYVKNDEVVAKINLSEEGTRIDGKLLEINSRTEFNADLVMNAGLIQDANGDITIDLNKGEINLSKPLTINAKPVATKEDVENIEMAYVASLSNDTALVPTDASGDNGDYSSAFTSIHIYQRDIDVTLQGWTFSATPSIGINGLLSGNDFTVTNMSVESGYVDVSAIKGSTVLTKRFSISKARKGETGGTGQSAKIIRLSVDKEVMTFNNDDTSNPANQTINIEAFIQGMTGNPTFTATAYNGSVSLGNVTTGFSGTGLKRSLSSSSFTANTTHITVTATLSGVTDKISIVKIKNGAQGDSGVSPVIGYLTNEAIVLPANSEGIVSNYEMADGYFRVFEGITDVSNQATFSELPSDNITINLNTSTGQYVVVDMEKEQSEGFADIKATFKGVEIVKRVSVSKSKQGIKGLDGADGYTPVKGADYFDGKDGANGVSSYLWVMYSQNANGNPMVDSPTDAKYIGVATTTTNTKPTAYPAYKWSLVKGTDGVKGETGADGKSSYMHIKYSDDGTTFTANNGETEGKWIGILVDFVETDSLTFSDYTWNKVAGEDGAGAKLLYLSASAETMTFNANNTPNPATQTISFTANLQNTTGTATFTAIPYNGTTAMTAITLGGSGNTRTLTQSQFPATATRIEIKAVLGGLTDTVSVAKLKNGLDGENSVVGYLTNESISIPTSSSGTFTPANLAKATGTFRVFDGLTEKTTDLSVVFSTSTKVGLDGNITANGIYTVTALTADVATLELRATYKGVTIYKTLTIVKSRAGVDGVDGVSITKIFNEYAVNNSPAIAPTTGWDEVAPDRTSGQYLWVREKVNYSNSSNEITGTRMVTGDKGDAGLDGKNALSVMLLNESQSVASTSGRIATVAQTIVIPFTAFVGTTRTSCTASVGTLPSGVTLGSVTNGTSSIDGVITLNVAKDATLGGTTSQFDAGSIEITITANNIGVKKFFNWTKSVSGVNGTTARTFFTESDVSVIVKKEDGSYTPSSFTFYSYYKDGSTANKTAYARFWKIETTVDGGNWTTFETKVDTTSTTYTVTSIPQNIVGIRATTYSTNALTSAHDTQSVMVISDGESGISITNVIAEYSVNNSKVTEPTTGWQETQPNRPEGSFIWRRDRVLYSDDSVTITKPVVMTGDKGDSGENAKLLYLSSNLESMIFNSDNTPNPSNQIATIEAKLQNVSGTVVYSATAYNGATSIGNVVLGGTGNVKTLSINNFPINASHVSVTATLGSLTDTISIFKIRHGEKGFDGTDGTDGQNAIVGILTNESITVPASENGAVTSFTGATGTFEVYDGTTRKTGSGVAYSVSGTPSGITVSINATTGIYTVSAMTSGASVLSGNATLQAVYNGVTIQKVLTVTKAMTGKTGATGSTGSSGSNAKIVTLTSSAQIFAKNASGVVSPASITVEGVSQNTSIATWEYSIDGGTFSSTLPTGLSRTGNVVSITGSSVTAKSISLRAKDASGISDVLSIAVVQDGAKGLDGSKGATGASGADAYTVVLSNEAHTFAGNTSSAIASSVTVNVVAYKGATRIGATIGTISGAVEGMSTSIATNGTTTASFTVSVTTAMSTTNGLLTIPITVDGKLFSKTFSFALALKGADGANGSAGANAKVIIVNPSAQIFTKDVNGNVTPSTITVDGTAQNVTISTWEYSIEGGTFSTSLPTGLTRSGNKVTITGSSMTAKNISVRASGSGVSDTTTIAMVQDGAKGSTGGTGAKGDNSIVGYLTNESVTLGASSTGVVSSFATASGTFRVFDGITEVTTNASCVFSLSSSTGVTLTINSSGIYTVTAMSADTATAEFKAVYKGITITKSMSLSKSRVGATGGQGPKGTDGKGISSAVVTYQNHTNGTTAPTGTWSSTIPTPIKGQYLWTRTITTYTDSSAIPTYSVAYNATDGQNGSNGATGVGISSTSIHYQLSTSGSTTPTGTWLTTVPAPVKGQYLWTRTIINYTNGTNSTAYSTSYYATDGQKGETGARGATGLQGPKGDTGTSVSSVTEYYLATSASSGILSTNAGFTTTIQTMTASNKYLWNYEKINFSDGTSQPTIPVIIGVYGDKGQTGSTGATGRSIVSITEHYLATSASSGVTRSTAGWNTTMQPTTETNKYLWNYETINWSSGTTPTYVEPIIIGVHGAKGATGSQGPQGVSPIVGLLTNESITLPASDLGVVLSSSFTGATGTLNVYEGTVLKNASATYSVVSQSGITVSITQSGVYTVTAMTTGASVLSGTATLRATYGGVTIDKILTVTKALAGSQGTTGGKGATGSAGQNATTYWINASTNAIKKDVTGTIVPSTITFSGFSKTGTANPVAYSGRFIIQTSTDGLSYTTAYTSSANQASYTYTIPATASFVKARYYLAGGTSILLDEQTIPVLVDAEGIDKKYEGQSLLDKTEILSGVGEVFTDKADDDSIVHVEIDGKSWQEPSVVLTNLIQNGDFSNSTNSWGATRGALEMQNGIATFTPNDTASRVGQNLGFQLNSRYYHAMRVKATGSKPMIYPTSPLGSSPTISGNGNWETISVLHSPSVTNTEIRYVYNGAIGIPIQIDWIMQINLTEAFGVGNEPSKEQMDAIIELNGYFEGTKILRTGDILLPKVNAPTPDYPIAIHSLNDFDVVSSVGRRNLVLNSEKEFHKKDETARITVMHSWEGLSEGTYAISFEYEIREDAGVEPPPSMLLHSQTTPHTGYITLPVGDWKGKTSGVFTVKKESENLGLTLYGSFSSVDSIGRYVIFRKIKIEKDSTVTPYSPALEDITEDDDHPLIDKTNILLSEPLRSVGDVKDRLFRDSDGLWKVERNIAETSLKEINAWINVSNTYQNDTHSQIGGTPKILAKRGTQPVSSHFEKGASAGNGTRVGIAVVGNLPQFRIRFDNITIGAKSDSSTQERVILMNEWIQNNHSIVLYEREEVIIETLPQLLQDKLNNISSYKDSNYVYTVVDKANILPEYVRDNLHPNMKATFKGGGWYARFKSEQEFIKAQEQMGNKADIEVIDNLKNDLQDYTKHEDYLSGIGEVNSSMESYKSLLETIERDLKGERDENGEFVLDVDGNPVNMGAIKEIEDIVNRESAIVNNLGELSERWNFIGTNIIMASEGLLIGETEIGADGKETLITGIRIGKDRVDFVENKVIVAEITGQRMKINRAIFVQSISVGEHKIETVSSGHTIWTWSPVV